MLLKKKLEVLSASLSDKGRVRDHNEDWILCHEPGSPAERSKGSLFLLADGMGGCQAGEVASQTALHAVWRHYYANPASDPGIRLVNAVQAANQQVLSVAGCDSSQCGMGTTIVATAIVGTTAYIAWVGDSRAYWLHDSRIKAVTQDHSYVADLVGRGVLTREQARRHEQRHVLSRALGKDASVQVDTVRVPLRGGDRLVLCSDGLTEHVDEGEILHTVYRVTPAESVCRLVALANDNGGSDNISVIVLAISGATTDDWLLVLLAATAFTAAVLLILIGLRIVTG